LWLACSNNLRRYQRRSGDHSVMLRVVREPREIGAAVSRYGDVESAGWKARTGNGDRN